MTTTKRTDFLLIGGGLCCAINADTLRKEGVREPIVILSAEGFLPYFRPQLAKAFLLQKRTLEQMLLFTEEYYKKNAIEVILNTKAVKVDPENKIVTTDHAGDFHFKQLLIATGCSPKKMDIPGSHLAKIYYLKTNIDAQPIVNEIEHAKKVVIIGGSYISIEIASLLIKKNIKVTIITDQFHLFNVSPSAEIAAFIATQGVEVLLDETIKKFKGIQCVQSIETHSGKNRSCDFVIVANHFVPEVDFLHDSGIHLDDGIVVDQYLKTNKEGIYAAGDVARFYDPVFRRPRRNGGIDNALHQGRISALNMMGMRKSSYNASYFFFQAFDNFVVIIGDTCDAKERITRGSLEERNCAIFYLNDGFLQGAFFSGRPIEEIKAAESLIINRVDISQHQTQLAHLNFSIENIATQTILTLQGGGALGAFECGVVKAMEEHGVYPDIVAGISIGAFNSAIIAANPKHATAALEAFWNDLSFEMCSIPNEPLRRLLSSWHAIAFGSPNFFYPRWAMPPSIMDLFPINWTSFYDASAIKNLLHKYIDFNKLKDSSIRLLVMAVNVETSEFETFDSYTENITAEHILASGSLPPGFPWTTINNKHYWDGGIVTNTPIDATLELCGTTNKKIYIVELYSRSHALPKNMVEVLARKEEILYSEKIRKDLENRNLISIYKELIQRILKRCDTDLVQEIKQLPIYIQTMGDPGIQSITRIARDIKTDEPYAWDSDFSRETIEQHKEKGYKTTKKILTQEKKDEKKV